MKIVLEIIQTRISKVYLRDDGVLQIDIAPDKSFDKYDYQELVDAARKIGMGRKFRNLIIVGEHTIPDAETRDISCSEIGSRFKIADAFVIHSMVQAMIGNVYMRLHQPFVPTRFFRSQEDALEWLKQFEEIIIPLLLLNHSNSLVASLHEAH
jgi:hypothetical protein